MSYSEIEINKVKQAADIRDFIPDIEHRGRKDYCRCPACGDTGMVVTQTTRMSLAKCFKCGKSIAGAISAVMEFDGKSYPEAIEEVAKRYGIPIETEQEQENRLRKERSKQIKGSFCLSQLTASGLTVEDVTAKVQAPDGTTSWTPTFRKGSLSMRTGVFDPNGDEMVIYYYDLYGMPIQTPSPASRSKLIPYARIRWSNPDARTDTFGRPIKYQSYKGAEARFYIPQKVRDYFANGTHIDTLFIQEGEKKAEKACKHGILSLGIQGIYNIGSKDSGLIQDLQYLVKRCTIRHVVLIFDSDWDDLNRTLQNGDDIDLRPRMFAGAAKKFRDYVSTLHNVNLSVDVWFGHVNPNSHNEKGIDDLLNGSLRGCEEILRQDIDYAMNSHDGKAEHISIHKISVATDLQIFQYWDLSDKDKFFDRHHDRIDPLQYFRFGKVNYRKNEDGKFEKASAQGTDKDFWTIEIEEKDGKEKKSIKFNHLAAFSFLEANGFYRIQFEEQGERYFEFIRISDCIVSSIGPHIVRDFAYRYALQNCKDSEVLNFLADKLSSLLSNDKLERLTMIEDNFDRPVPDVQTTSYTNGQLRITASGVQFGSHLGFVWRDNVIQRRFKRVPIFESIRRHPDGSFDIIPTEQGQDCEFYLFLENTSNFWKERMGDLSPEETKEYTINIVNKLTSIGYLLFQYKYGAEKKAVVAMDAKMSEVGRSNGRSGKSLIGVALSHMLAQETIDGKSLKNDDDFLFSTITTHTRNVFIDDVKVNFDFPRLYPAITGKLNINPKQAQRYTIPFEKAPKFYITTNHAINDTSDSSKARLAYMSFSDWYNVSWSPVNDFGHEFFEAWDDEQWTLFDNLMAECVQLYLRSRAEGWVGAGAGIVPPPMQDLEARQFRQKMGEAFLQWAEAAFDPSGNYLNVRTNRKTLYDNFCQEYPGQRQFVSSSSFRERLLYFCQYAGLHFNPHRPTDKGVTFAEFVKSNPGKSFAGNREASGGEVYFTVCSDEYARSICL